MKKRQRERKYRETNPKTLYVFDSLHLVVDKHQWIDSVGKDTNDRVGRMASMLNNNSHNGNNKEVSSTNNTNNYKIELSYTITGIDVTDCGIRVVTLLIHTLHG